MGGFRVEFSVTGIPASRTADHILSLFFWTVNNFKELIPYHLFHLLMSHWLHRNILLQASYWRISTLFCCHIFTVNNLVCSILLDKGNTQRMQYYYVNGLSTITSFGNKTASTDNADDWKTYRHVWNWTPDHPACGPLTTLITLSWLQECQS